MCGKIQPYVLLSVNNSKFATNFFHQFQADWYLAKEDCKVKGMELISIESMEEQNALVNQIGTPL